MAEDDLRLTSREEEILRLISGGLPNKQIARELGISESTVRTHLERLYARNDLHTRAEAVALWANLNRTGPALAKARIGRGLTLWLICTPLVVTVGLISYMVSPSYLWSSLVRLAPVAAGLAGATIALGAVWQVIVAIRRRRLVRRWPPSNPSEPPLLDSTRRVRPESTGSRP